MPLFDAWMMVDWSASKVRNRGADSIWIGLTRRGRRRQFANPATRREAVATIADMLAGQLAGDRVLVGWDFPFGYPAGTAAALGGGDWRTLWETLAEAVHDADDNANNRFEVARNLNRRLSGDAFPFWGHDGQHEHPYLRRRQRRARRPGDLPERRLVESRVPRTQPVWKLAGVGSVGSQALLGIPRVRALRNDGRFAAESAVWPFETGLAAPCETTRIVHAEIYPSLIAPLKLAGWPKDAGQVAALGGHFARLDKEDKLAPLFEPGVLLPEERACVAREEAWILGVG